MNKGIWSIIAFALLCAVENAEAQIPGAKRVRVTLEVVDEEGKPVPNARAGSIYPGVGPQQLPDDGARITNEQGVYVETAYSIGIIESGAEKQGYYGSGFRYNHGGEAPRGVALGRRWPDVTKRIMIRRVGNPVPMYVYRFSRRLPKEGEEAEIGFDFLKADWVAPHGRGESADVMIQLTTFDREEHGAHSGKITWRFPRRGDGMILVNPADCYWDSQFTMPRFAPEAGYEANWWGGVIRQQKEGYPEHMKESGQELSATTPYFLRIRSEYDEKGNLIRALYGKISKRDASIGWAPRFFHNAPTVAFIYYINPDGTRNMEWDPKRNLFQSILKPQDYEVRHP